MLPLNGQGRSFRSLIWMANEYLGKSPVSEASQATQSPRKGTLCLVVEVSVTAPAWIFPETLHDESWVQLMLFTKIRVLFDLKVRSVWWFPL